MADAIEDGRRYGEEMLALMDSALENMIAILARPYHLLGAPSTKEED